MLCTKCNYRGEMKVRRGEYEYQSLPGTTLRNVAFHECPECDAEAVAIPAIEQLDESLASDLVRKEAPLTPEEFRFLRKYLGWSGRDTAMRMGVEPETVSRWEHDQRRIGRTADRLIRALVMLESPVDNYGAKDLAGIHEGAQQPERCLELKTQGWELCA